MLRWKFFTPLSEFLLHLEHFTPIQKNFRNTIITANTKIFAGRKIPPLNLYPPNPFRNVLIRVISVDFYFLGNHNFRIRCLP